MAKLLKNPVFNPESVKPTSHDSTLSMSGNPTPQLRCELCCFFKFGWCNLTGTSGHRPTNAPCGSFTTEAPPPPMSCGLCRYWKHGYCEYGESTGHRPDTPACDVFCLAEEPVLQEQSLPVTPSKAPRRKKRNEHP